MQVGVCGGVKDLLHHVGGAHGWAGDLRGWGSRGGILRDLLEEDVVGAVHGAIDVRLLVAAEPGHESAMHPDKLLDAAGHGSQRKAQVQAVPLLLLQPLPLPRFPLQQAAAAAPPLLAPAGAASRLLVHHFHVHQARHGTLPRGSAAGLLGGSGGAVRRRGGGGPGGIPRLALPAETRLAVSPFPGGHGGGRGVTAPRTSKVLLFLFFAGRASHRV